jgi:hypothetical protein
LKLPRDRLSQFGWLTWAFRCGEGYDFNFAGGYADWSRFPKKQDNRKRCVAPLGCLSSRKPSNRDFENGLILGLDAHNLMGPFTRRVGGSVCIESSLEEQFFIQHIKRIVRNSRTNLQAQPGDEFPEGCSGRHLEKHKFWSVRLAASWSIEFV